MLGFLNNLITSRCIHFSVGSRPQCPWESARISWESLCKHSVNFTSHCLHMPLLKIRCVYWFIGNTCQTIGCFSHLSFIFYCLAEFMWWKINNLWFLIHIHRHPWAKPMVLLQPNLSPDPLPTVPALGRQLPSDGVYRCPLSSRTYISAAELGNTVCFVLT